jgi:hypothetical protein
MVQKSINISTQYEIIRDVLLVAQVGITQHEHKVKIANLKQAKDLSVIFEEESPTEI